MTDDEFMEELGRIWAALVSDLRVPALRLVVQAGVLKAHVQGPIVIVPEAYARHFARFSTLPTAVVRDLAYEAKRLQLSTPGAKRAAVEADAMAYAEAFLRAALLQDH